MNRPERAKRLDYLEGRGYHLCNRVLSLLNLGARFATFYFLCFFFLLIKESFHGFLLSSHYHRARHDVFADLCENRDSCQKLT
jgi:predicted PurR-regulated permease PerM